MVEMAIALPVILMILFAILQFGVVFHDYLALTDAVRVGSRKAAVSREVPDPVGKTKSAVQAAAPNLNLPSDDIDVVSPWTPGSDVTVTATYPYSLKLYGVSIMSGSLSSSTTERVE